MHVLSKLFLSNYQILEDIKTQFKLFLVGNLLRLLSAIWESSELSYEAMFLSSRSLLNRADSVVVKIKCICEPCSL